MAGPRQGGRGGQGAALVLYEYGDGRAGGDVPGYAGGDLKGVGLQRLAGAAARGLAAAPELAGYVGATHFYPGGEAFQYARQIFAVRFAGGKITQHLKPLFGPE